MLSPAANELTHWGRVTHICVGELTIIVSDNGLSPGRRQAIIWTNVGILLIGPPGTNFSEISIKILTFSFAKMRLKVSSAKWRPFCLGLNVLSNPPGWVQNHPRPCLLMPWLLASPGHHQSILHINIQALLCQCKIHQLITVGSYHGYNKHI